MREGQTTSQRHKKEYVAETQKRKNEPQDNQRSEQFTCKLDSSCIAGRREGEGGRRRERRGTYTLCALVDWLVTRGADDKGVELIVVQLLRVNGRLVARLPLQTHEPVTLVSGVHPRTDTHAAHQIANSTVNNMHLSGPRPGLRNQDEWARFLD